MPPPNTDGRITLEQLLRLKRCERPADAFWADFDRAFHNRRLQSMVRQPDPGEGLGFRLRAVCKLLLPLGVPAMLLLAFAVYRLQPVYNEDFGTTGGEALAAAGAEIAAGIADPTPVRQDPPQPVFMAASPAQFIIDAISSEPRQPEAFRRVMHQPGLQVEQAAAVRSRYVADPIQGARVQPAKLPAGRGF
jgi:hypothetical protein